MRENFIPSAALAATIAACAHGPKGPSIKLSEVQPAESNAVAFCEELLAESIEEERVPMNDGPDALLKSVEFKIDNTVVAIRCGYMDRGQGKKPRLVQIDVAEVGSNNATSSFFTDQFSFRDGILGSSWNPDGCIDKAYVQIGNSPQQHRVRPVECPPYAREPRDLEDVAARAAQQRFTQITSAARALLRQRQLLPPSRADRK